MGSGVSHETGGRAPCGIENFSEEEVDEMFRLLTKNFADNLVPLMEKKGMAEAHHSEHDALFIAMIERKFILPPGSFETFLANHLAPATGGGGDGLSVSSSGLHQGEGMQPVIEESHSRMLNNMVRVHESEASEHTHHILEPRLSHNELRSALTSAGFISEHQQEAMLEKLYIEIETILGKKPAIVVQSTEVHSHDWKALQILGDNDMIDQARSAGTIDVHTDKNKKALQQMGTVKAIESKKIRDRLGSDMSTNQLHKMKIAELREKKAHEKGE